MTRRFRLLAALILITSVGLTWPSAVAAQRHAPVGRWRWRMAADEVLPSRERIRTVATGRTTTTGYSYQPYYRPYTYSQLLPVLLFPVPTRRGTTARSIRAWDSGSDLGLAGPVAIGAATAGMGIRTPLAIRIRIPIHINTAIRTRLRTAIRRPTTATVPRARQRCRCPRSR